MISTPFRSLNSLSIFPTSAFSFPYISCLRYFGAKTIWYLLCDKLFTHPLTRTSRAAFSWLPDHFYSSPGGSSFLLSVFYPPPVQLGGSCLFGDKKGTGRSQGVGRFRILLVTVRFSFCIGSQILSPSAGREKHTHIQSSSKAPVYS